MHLIAGSRHAARNGATVCKQQTPPLADGSDDSAFVDPSPGGDRSVRGLLSRAQRLSTRRFVIALVVAGLLGMGGGSAAAVEGPFVAFSVANCQNIVEGLNAVTAGPDGNLWFTDPTGGIGRITPTGGSSSCFPVAYASNPTGIVAGSDGNVWFMENGDDQIGRVTPTGTIKTFAIPTSSGYFSTGVNPSDIAAGPDGNVWFTELGDNQIARITPSGTITEFDVTTMGAHPTGITTGADGNLWFTELDGNQIGRITPTGTIAEFPVPTSNSRPGPITAGADGNVWFAETAANQIGRITPAGTITEFPIPTAGGSPGSITKGPDGNVWFTESNQVEQITPTGTITVSSVPSAVRGITSGPDGNLWMVETQPNAAQAFPTNVVARMPAAPLPTNISPPTISGSTEEGQTLTENHGTWTNSPSSYIYQWEDCSSSPYGEMCHAIPGAASQSYTLGASDIGFAIRVQETATTTGGGTGNPALSTITAVVQQSPPVNTAAPTMAGAAIQGKMLSEAHGSWTNGPTSYHYQWKECDSSGHSCAPIAGATNQNYTLHATDVGHTIRVQETASNAGGNGPPATSAASAIVQVAPGAKGTPTVGHVKVTGTSAAVPLTCNGGPGAICKLILTLTVTETVKGRTVIAVSAAKRPKIKKTIVLLGTATMALTADRTTVIRITLNGTGTRLLSRYHVLKVSLRIRQSGKMVSSQTVTFKTKPKHRHKH